MSKSVAVILSGGSGSRFGGLVPKQFTKLAGKAVMEYTIQQFEDAPSIDEIIIVSQPLYIEKTWDLVKQNDWKKVSKVVVGGKERFDSTASAITAMHGYDPETKVLFHDSVRPLVTNRIIEDCVDKLSLFEAVDVVIPSADTLVEVYDDGCIANIPNRANMRRGQTPQAFLLKTISAAYAEAKRQNRSVFTCDCGVVRAMLPHLRVATVLGSESNMKITQPIDLFIAEKLLQSSERTEINDRLDLDLLKGKVIAIFGGSSGIGQAIHDMALLRGAKVFSASRSANQTDVADKNSIAHFLKSVYDQAGKIDYVVNTAGLLIKKPIDTLSDQEILDLININYMGAINVAIEAKPYLSDTKGMLLNFTSSSYTRGRAYYALYSSSKSAIVNLTQALADEWNAFGIRINCINPERTKTPMREENFGEEDPNLLLSAEEVAKTSLATLLNNKTGIIVDVRKDGR
ncbi:2-C-methyl-D-erythritol 4-phosphate cytidylyltransferase [Neisseria perflava]|uniref:bifunctional cytidylyltransferase/SDR family oxidoreductase n=1 Tax=Neisseria perflava TaxID=33053 RepID=UPI00209F15D8|nr:bifunctional cytidylyltransferase/SDR family oxidoreductase [Neisseria perflava]MCP1772827.1 2-C-methyl-D-erythritol 4-phosphate cytidylyltransferase [Neisseria perflava]